MGNFLLFLWLVSTMVQSIMAFGTAYRKTKENGDNGVSLWGWMFVYDLAALIPGLGFYLWKKSFEDEGSESHPRGHNPWPASVPRATWFCEKCNEENDADSVSCTGCKVYR